LSGFFYEAQDEIVKAIKLLKKVSFRDVLLVSGLALISVGLWLFMPWVAFTVCGVIIFAGGFFMGEK
jgi:hypothetical protein